MSRLSRWYVYIQVCYVHIPCYYSPAYVYLGKQVGFRSSDLSGVKVAQIESLFFLSWRMFILCMLTVNILRFRVCRVAYSNVHITKTCVVF